jgi:hypothetical protein
MLELMLAAAILIPLWYGYKRSVEGRLVIINHVTTFTFGFLFYWIVPMVVGVYGSRFAAQLSELYVHLFDEHFVTGYLAVCIGLYLCFVLGDLVGARLCRHRASSTPSIPRVALSLVTVAGCVLALYISYALRAELLVPYGMRVTFNTARGTLTTCVVLLGVVALMFTLDRPEVSWRERLGSRYFVPFLAGCAAFLWMGTRLYVMSFFVMFAVYQSNFREKFRFRTILSGVMVLVVASGAVAMWRSQGDLTDAAVSVVQEPVLASLSLAHYLSSKGIAWTNSPVYLASDFVNLVPALVLPDKAAFRKRPPVYSPLGALNSFVSFNLNFGVLGTAVFLFLLAIGFQYLKSRSSSTLFATMYIMCSGWMASTFFRDPFHISLIKVILQDSIIAPMMVVVLGRILAAACSRARRTTSDPEVPIGVSPAGV